MKPTYTAIATSSGRESRAITSDGRFDLPLALPRELGGTGNGTNPEQLFAAGWAACFATSISLVAQSRGVEARDVAVTAELSLVRKADGLGFGLAARLRVKLPEHLVGESGAGLVEAAHQVCPYSIAIRGNVPVDVVVE
jgi:Ohr subfamily peroxiredoxin